MRIKDINKEMLNQYYKDKRVFYDEMNDKILVTDSYRMYVLNESDFILDKNKLRKVDLSRFIDDSGYIESTITNNLKFMDKIILRTISNENKSLLVNNKYLKLFDNPEVKIKDDHSPVLVYEKGEFVGLILPIKEY